MSEVASEIRDICYFIIGNINEDGYLILPVEEIAESLKVSEEQVEKALLVVQSLDPIGVGCQDLQECLLIQMRAAGLGNSLAEQLVLDFLPLIQAKKFRELAKQPGLRTGSPRRSHGDDSKFFAQTGSEV